MRTHGLSNSRIYHIWRQMKMRCLSLNQYDYRNYGGRGITVCKEWMRFEPFYSWAIANGYREGLSIERKDNNGNYEPGNCEWIPFAQQARNKRNTRYVTYNGEKKTLAEWSEILGIQPQSVLYRFNNWPIDKVFTTPVKSQFHRGSYLQNKKAL